MPPTKKLLFVCVENSCRSQMAEGLARMIGGDAIEAFSAGSRPSGVVNPKAVATMAEIDYDLGSHASKSIDDVGGHEFAAVITMGCGDSCPHVAAALRDDWAIPDPKHMAPDEFREVRETIAEKIRLLLDEV